jgi:hypothetical protein
MVMDCSDLWVVGEWGSAEPGGVGGVIGVADHEALAGLGPEVAGGGCRLWSRFQLHPTGRRWNYVTSSSSRMTTA